MPSLCQIHEFTTEPFLGRQVANFETCPNELLVMNHANSKPGGLREYIARSAEAGDFPAVEGLVENYPWGNDPI